MSFLVKLLCPPGGVVLDPFAGSGTTGVAAVQDGYGFTGIELDPIFADAARNRIAAAAAQPKLAGLSGPQWAGEQVAMFGGAAS